MNPCFDFPVTLCCLFLLPNESFACISHFFTLPLPFPLCLWYSFLPVVCLCYYCAQICYRADYWCSVGLGGWRDPCCPHLRRLCSPTCYHEIGRGRKVCYEKHAPLLSGRSVSSSFSVSCLSYVRDVTRYLQLLLRREGHIFKTTAEFEVIRAMKEVCCHLLVPF